MDLLNEKDIKLIWKVVKEGILNEARQVIKKEDLDIQ